MRAIVIAAMLALAGPVMAADVPAPDYGPTINYEDGVKIGEAYAKSDLLDPYSVVFEWPYKFVQFSYSKKVYGYASCFTQNAKNAMGGYIGVRMYRIIIRNGAVVENRPVSDLQIVPDICKLLIDKFGMEPESSAVHR
jgi:hypothetical protein